MQKDEQCPRRRSVSFGCQFSVFNEQQMRDSELGPAGREEEATKERSNSPSINKHLGKKPGRLCLISALDPGKGN